VLAGLSAIWDDVNLYAWTVKISQEKGGDERVAHLPQPLVVALANIPSNREPSARVFGYASHHDCKHTWRRTALRAGIAPLTHHRCGMALPPA